MTVIRTENFDLNKFHRDGYAVGQIEPSIADSLLSHLKRQTFNYPSVVSETEKAVYKADSGLFYCDCVTNFTLPEGDNTRAPMMGMAFENTTSQDYFEQFWTQLSTEPYFQTLFSSFGNFSQFSKQMMHYHKSEGLSWHYDWKDSSFLINMIYLTDFEMVEEDGGYIEFGICNYTGDNHVISNDEIVSTGKVLPRHGTIITANNLNPNFVHRVPAMMSNKERYTLICQFGYAANVLYSVKAKQWNIQ